MKRKKEHAEFLTIAIFIGLKKYSDWPTYPQLYGDGELIGGVDIVKVSFVFLSLQSVTLPCVLLCFFQ